MFIPLVHTPDPCNDGAMVTLKPEASFRSPTGVAEAHIPVSWPSRIHLPAHLDNMQCLSNMTRAWRMLCFSVISNAHSVASLITTISGASHNRCSLYFCWSFSQGSSPQAQSCPSCCFAVGQSTSLLGSACLSLLFSLFPEKPQISEISCYNSPFISLSLSRGKAYFKQGYPFYLWIWYLLQQYRKILEICDLVM